MKKIMYVMIGLAVFACLISTAAAADTGGERGFIQVKCDVDGATASLIGVDNKVFDSQPIVNGQCEFIVYTTGTPVNRVIIAKDGYITNGAQVSSPGAGKTNVVAVTLEPRPGTGLIGGDRGFYRIETNVIGAEVSLISHDGTPHVAGYTDIYGVSEIPVYTVGTPNKGVKVSAPGWTTVERDDLEVPGVGQTLTYKVTLQLLNPTTAPTAVPTAAPTAAPTAPAPSPFPILGILAGIAALGAAALVKRD